MVNTSLTEYWLSRAGKTTMTEPEPQPSLIFRLRSHGAYQQFFFQLKRRIMPFVWGVALIFLAVFSVSQADLYLRNYSVPQLAFCPAPGPSQATTAIDIENLCNDTGFDVRAGTMYALKIRPEKTCDGATQNKPWFDASIPASPAGVTSDDSNSLVSTLSLPIRRVLDQKLFAPIIQINQTFPKVTPASEYGFWAREGDGEVWLGYFKANASGRAYFFVNDAVAPLLPSSLQFFYGNNCGKGTLSIEKFQ